MTDYEYISYPALRDWNPLLSGWDGFKQAHGDSNELAHVDPKHERDKREGTRGIHLDLWFGIGALFLVMRLSIKSGDMPLHGVDWMRGAITPKNAHM
jgi:hypothetical protein